jgi:hypothetical protein
VKYQGATPFFIAAMAVDVPWMRFLAANGANPHIPTLANITPALAAAGVGFKEGEPGTREEALEAVKFCYQLGCDMKAVVRGGVKPDQTWEGATAMHGAASRASADLILWLADKGVPLDAKTVRGVSAYHLAAGIRVNGVGFNVAIEVGDAILRIAKERGETIDTAPPAGAEPY